jgi:GT2 family glycosyltransferase
LIRRSLFEQLGGFDEQFFVYYEDLDLSLRVAHARHQVWFEAAAICHHVGGGISQQFPVERLLYARESRAQYARKHFRGAWPALILASVLVVEPLTRSAASLARLDWAELALSVSLAGKLWRSSRLWT